MNKHLVKALATASRKSWTGAFYVRDAGTHSRARIYVFEGGVYSIHLADYHPNVVARLISTGNLDPADYPAHRAEMAAGSVNLDAGRMAVGAGTLSVEELADIPEEYLLASLGAVLARPVLGIEPSRNTVTSHYCTLPTRLDSLVSAVGSRNTRTTRAAETLGASSAGGAVVLRAVRSTPSARRLPGLHAFADSIDGDRTIDQIAAAMGLTRAEALFTASVLIAAGMVEVFRVQTPVGRARLLAVPEDFGHVVVVSGDK